MPDDFVDSKPDFLYKKVAKGVLFSYIAVYLTVFLQFLATIVLINNLSVQDYGVYSILFSTVTFLTILVSIFWFSIVRFVPSYIEEKNFFLAKKFVKIALLFSVAIGLLFLVLFFFLPQSFNAVFQGNAFDPVYIQIFAFLILFNFISGTLDWTLIALIEPKVRNIARLIYAVVFLGGVYYALTTGFGLAGVLVVVLIAYLLLSAIDFFKVRQLLFSRPSIGEKKFELRRILRFSVLSEFAFIGDTFISLIWDIFLIGIFLGPEAAGWYAFAIKVPQTIIGFSPAMLGASVIFPFVIRKFTQTKNKNVLSYFFRVYNRFTAFITLPAIAGMVLLAEPIIRLVFNEQYITSLPVFIIASVISTIIAFRYVIMNIFNTIEKPEIAILSKFWFLLSMALNVYLLMNGEGILVVITVTGVAVLLMYITELLLTRRHVEMHFPLRSFAKIAFNTSVMAVVIYLISGFATSIIGLAFAVLTGVLVYFALSFFIRPFTKKDAEIFAKGGRIGKLLWFFCK